MIGLLALRHLVVKKRRSLVLLLGYGLGVGVMIVLLSIGEALLDQSRDVSLVGGGEVTVLPEGIDVEAMRTGGVSGMFFTIDRARFVARQVLAGPRHREMVRAVSPAIENKLMYLGHQGTVLAVRAGGEIPSGAAAVGAPLRLLEGAWLDTPEDSAWIAPTRTQLYHELDRFHYSTVADSAWGEWHYFNITLGPNEWWYVTFLVGGEVPAGRWGGRLLMAHRRRDGSYDRYTSSFSQTEVAIDTSDADVMLGPNRVTQLDGVYRLVARATGPVGTVQLDLAITPESNRYFPPLELGDPAFPSGYVVPALSASASGTICVAGNCAALDSVTAYHDHNWGVWRDVTWDWGAARGSDFNLLYGAVYPPDDSLRTVRTGAPKIFVALVDSLGVKQILRARSVVYEFDRVADRPSGFSFTASRLSDTVRIRAAVEDALATEQGIGAMHRHFLQMRGRFSLVGTVGGRAIADSGNGYFETYLR